MSFSATITASFNLGSDDQTGKLWKRDTATAAHEPAGRAPWPRQAPAPLPALVWQPLMVAPADRFPLTLHFLPHLTVNADAGTQQAAYVAMLYIEAPAADALRSHAADTSSLGSLATGVLAWAINALLNSDSPGTTYAGLLTQRVSADNLGALLGVFDGPPNNVPPFGYHHPAQPGLDVRAFLQQLFTVNILAADPTRTSNAAVFPPLPDLQLQDLRNGEPLTTVDFAQWNLTGETYFADITALLQRLGANAPNNPANEQAAARPLVDDRLGAAENSQSLPTFFFTEYVALLAKHMLQQALGYLTGAALTDAPVEEVLTNVRTTANIAGLAGMASRLLLRGLRLPAPPVPPATGFGPVQPLYVLTGQQLTLPTLTATDTYQVQLMKAAATTWIEFDGGTNLTLPLTIVAAEITRATQTAGLTLAPPLAAGFPKAMVNYFDHAQPFPLGRPAQWHYPGAYFKDQEPATNPHLLPLPDHLRAALAQLAAEGQSIDFTLHALRSTGETSPVTQLCWATAVAVTLQKLPEEEPASPIVANRYRLVGTDDAGVAHLHHLLAYLQTPAGQDFAATVQLLYQPDSVGNLPGSYVSAANNTTTPGDQLAMAIVQANRPADANPEPATRRGLEASTPVPANTLNSFADFVTLLWECSTVRSGSYYFYYQDKADHNAGLPDALFDANGAATVQMLLTYPQFLTQPFLNSVVIGDALDYSSVSVSAQSTALLVRSAIRESGSVGYVLERPAAAHCPPATLPPTLADNQAYLDNQFNLVGISLPGIAAYQDLLPAGPLATPGPTGQLPGPDASWSYSGAVAYAQFVQPADPLYGFADPYAGVGTTVALRLNWQDPFGNTLPFAAGTGDLSPTLRYTDPLLAVSQWPSVTVGYQFVAPQDGAAPELQLVFGFPTTLPVRYQGDAGPGNARFDLCTWMRLWFQLQHAADLSLSFTASIDGTAAAPLGSVRSVDLGALQTQFVRPVIDYLYTLANAGATAPVSMPVPESYTISSPVAPDSITSHVDVFPLAVHLTLARTQHVDPGFAPHKSYPASGVDSAVTAVQPLADPGSSTATPVTEFARRFEAAFNTGGPVCLKVATPPNPSTDTRTGTPLWVVRFDTSGGSQGIGLKYQLNQYGQTTAAYYAPIPLGKSPLSFDAPVAPYTTGNGTLGSSVPTRFTGIDLDDWGQQLLEAVDRFFMPAYAVPAFLLDNGASLQQVLEAKQTLANAIAGTVDNIIQPHQQGEIPPQNTPTLNVRNAAQTKWRQQLRVQLTSAYAYAASVQTPVTVTSHFQGLSTDPPVAQGPPRLYGQLLPAPTAEDGTAPERSPQACTLSAAKLPIGAGVSWLTYLFQCQAAADFRSFAFDNLRFAVSHLEWNDAPGVGDDLSPALLALVLPTTLPLSFTDLGAVDVPMPLRAYPTPLSVTEQLAVNPSVHQSELANDVLKARSWDYQFTYRTSSFAQDTVAVQVQFNVGSEEDPLAQNPSPAALTLPETLAQFISVYPALSADFDQYLTQVRGRGPGPAQAAVQVFVGLVQRVGAAWSAWNQIHSLKSTNMRQQAALTADVLPLTLNYQVAESSQAETADLLITVTANPANSLLTTARFAAPKPLLLSIDIPGYQRAPTVISDNQVQYTYTSTDPATPGRRLPYKDRNQMPTRRATAPTLDILNQQNARAGLAIARNQDLLRVPGSDTEWQGTNPYFVYHTPLVMFSSELVPLFPSGEVVPIDINGLPGAATPRSLGANLAALGTALTQQVRAGITSLNVKVECQYAYDLAPGLPVTVPVLLALPFDLSTADQGQRFAQRLTAALHEWQQQHQPATAGASWLFGVSVFSAYAAGPPVLQLSFDLKTSDMDSVF